METESIAPSVKNHRGNFVNSGLLLGKMPNLSIVAPSKHRLLWIFLIERTDIFSGTPKKLLHVAPESCLEPRFKKLLGNKYLTADLYHPGAMIKMDITNIQYPDQSFDIIYCSHVLEHVLDNRKSMSEFYRILDNTDWAILFVPITTEKTFVDHSIVNPEERLRIFGQEDHVRRYDPDYVDRLCSSGFHVEVESVSDLVQKDEGLRMGLTHKSGSIFYCANIVLRHLKLTWFQARLRADRIFPQKLQILP